MPANIKDILNNIKDIYMTDSSLESLLDYERVLDDLDLYSFENWKKGELVEGPIYEKYFVTCTFMWPYKLMPDPRGGERLLDYDCEVYYSKDTLEYPIKVENPDDFEKLDIEMILANNTNEKKNPTHVDVHSTHVINFPKNVDLEIIQSPFKIQVALISFSSTLQIIHKTL